MRVPVGRMVALLVVFAGAAPLWGGISVAPSFVEVHLDKGRPAGRFEVANLGETEERYRVKALYFNFTSDGNLVRPDPDEHSLVSWIKFNPAELTIAPKSSRLVRFVIVPQGKLIPGEYWAAMELESLNTQVGKGEDKGGHEMEIRVLTSVLVPIFGSVGTVRYDGTFDEFKVTAAPKASPEQSAADWCAAALFSAPLGVGFWPSFEAAAPKGTLLETHLTNRGDGRLLLKGEYEVLNASGQSIEKAPLGYAYVLPGTDRIFQGRVRTTLPAGTYTLRAKYECPQLKTPLTKETTLKLDAPSPGTPPPSQPGDAPAGKAGEKPAGPPPEKAPGPAAGGAPAP